MAIDFPNSPNVNDTYTVDDKTFIWTGDYWRVLNSPNYISTLIKDADNDTKVEVEQSADEDTVRITTGGTERYSIGTDGHIIPTANEAYDLGSASNRFRDLYLSGTSIDLGGVSITSDGTNLALPPISSVSGDFTVDTDTLHVDSTNNRVGIGTTSPDSLLEIKSSRSELKISSSEGDPLTNHSGRILFENTNISDTYDAAAIEIHGGSDAARNGSITFLTNPTGTTTPNGLLERMIIDELGNVGIGTTSPAYELDVNGRARLGGAGDDIYVGVSGTSSNVFHYGGRLHLEGTGDYPNDINFHSNNDGSYWHLNGPRELEGDVLSLYHYNGSVFTLNTSFKPDGKVGIGTNNPGYSLDINGNAAVRSGLSFFDGTNSAGSVSTNGASGSANKVQITGNRGLGGVIVQVNQGQAALFNYNRMVYLPYVYSNTTGSGANMLVASDGNLFRSTSSVKYKTDVEDLQDSYADVVLNLRPVWYRSLCDGDPDDWSYYGLIAEEVAEVEPRLVHFGPSADCTCQPSEEDGLTHHEQSCLTEPEGVQYDRLVPHLISLAQRQNATIQELTARIEALETN